FKIRWDPGGNYLAAPGRAHDIQLIKRGTWRTAVTLKGGHTGSVTHLAWSPSGSYIASIAAEDSRLVVWDHTIPDPILTHEHSSPLCQVDWHPHANILAFTSQMGSAFVWDDILPKNLPSPHLPLSSDGKRTTKVSTPFTADGHNALTPIDDLFNDDKDRRSHQAVDDTDNDALNYDIGDDGESIGDEDDDGYGRDDGDPLGGFVVEDGIKGYSEPPAQWVPPKHVKVSAFQPGSTPAIHGRRYLALNLIGSVVTIEQDTEHNIIEIDFYDKSAHRDIHFRDTNKFSMASLSNQGCLFAAKSRQTGKGADGNNDDPDHRPSFLSYRAYSSWSAVSNWM
ncbi:DNA polymerase alpha accessory factor Mcl1, partial [Spiromyces aspiralis]